MLKTPRLPRNEPNVFKSVQQEMESIDKDQSRLRENIKALKGSSEEKALLQRYTKELDDQEDRLLTPAVA